jgi:SmpA/OmlA family protein
MMFASLVLVAGLVQAQAPATIDPGMTQEQVVSKLGKPLSSRSYDGYTYLFYRNGCEKKCGMNDLVVLDSGKVVDAVFRSVNRHYSGTSSSPRMISAADARHGVSGDQPLKTQQPPTPDKPKKPDA